MRRGDEAPLNPSARLAMLKPRMSAARCFPQEIAPPCQGRAADAGGVALCCGVVLAHTEKGQRWGRQRPCPATAGLSVPAVWKWRAQAEKWNRQRVPMHRPNREKKTSPVSHTKRQASVQAAAVSAWHHAAGPVNAERKRWKWMPRRRGRTAKTARAARPCEGARWRLVSPRRRYGDGGEPARLSLRHAEASDPLSPNGRPCRHGGHRARDGQKPSSR